MKKMFGIGEKLLVAFGGVVLLTVISGAVAWMAFNQITEVQKIVVTDTVPSLNQVRSLAQVSAMVTANTPKLVGATSEDSRSIEAQVLFDLSKELSKIIADIETRGIEAAEMLTLKSIARKILVNIETLNELVTARIALTNNYSSDSDHLLNIINDVVDLSEALVSNAAATTSASVVNLYSLAEKPNGQIQIHSALDDLIEIDVDHMELMFEMRHRVAVTGLIIEQLEKADADIEVASLRVRYIHNVKIIERRTKGIRDPNRREQALNNVVVLIKHISTDNEKNIFDLRLQLIISNASITQLVATNRQLTNQLANMVEMLVTSAETRMSAAVDKSETVLQRSYYWLLFNALISFGIAIPILWFYVRNDVVKRVRKLASATLALSNDNQNIEINDKGSDELSDMASALIIFKNNAEDKKRLEIEQKKTETELRKHKQKLEQIVEKRTAQLTQANQQLSLEVKKHAEASAMAEKANRAKSAFLASMSHEIRTPIASILGTLHLLNDELLDDSVHQRHDFIRASSETLLSIINDILDYSKIEAGHLDVISAVFNLTDLVNDIRLLMAPVAERKSIALVVASDLDSSAYYQGDAGHIRQVLINLVGNALKFTDQGQVVMHVYEATGGVVFDVEDTGIGISEQNQAHLFDAFYQSDDYLSKRVGGTGLGLTICRRLVTAMEGSINVISNLGAGSLFQVIIPLKKSYQTALIHDASANTEDLSLNIKLNVLLVEDNEINREITKTFLERAGHEVVAVETGAEALKSATNDDFDIVLMDISLPDMDGLSVTKAIRNQDNPARGKVPIIAISAHVFCEEIDSYLAGGMDGFLAKPFSPQQLANAMTTTMHGENIIEKNGRLPFSTENDIIFDPDILNADISILGVERVQRLLALFLDKIGSDVASIMSACDGGDIEAVGNLAHALKSAAGSLGALALSNYARNMEIAAKSKQMQECTEIQEKLSSIITETCFALREYSDELS